MFLRYIYIYIHTHTHTRNLAVWKIFIFNISSATLQLSTSTSKFPLKIFFAFFGVSLVDNTFSIGKGKNLAWQTSSKDSMTINLGKSVASPSEFDSDRFPLFLFIRGCHRCCIFFAVPVLHHPTWNPTSVGNKPKGKPICLGCDRDTQPVYSSRE